MSLLFCGSLDGRSHDFDVSAAAAQVVLELFPYLLFGGMRIAIKQRLNGHDHAVQAITALGSLLLYKGPLNRVGFLNGAQAFKRGDLAGHHRLHWYHARTRRHTIDQYRTGPAFAQTAAKLGAVQFQVVSKHVQQRCIGFHRDMVGLPVNVKGEDLRAVIHWFYAASALISGTLKTS